MERKKRVFMTSMFKKSLAWIAATTIAAGIAFAGGQQIPVEKGEQILSQSCLGCHDMRPIAVQALDADGWTKIVNAMIDKGAQVKKDDIPDFVEYLVRKHGPLPNGAGKAIVLNVCTMCHDLDRITVHRASREEWEDILQSMLNEGADLSDEQFAVVLNYLARNYRPE